MPARKEAIAGVFERIGWQAPDGDYCVGFLEGGQTVCGNARQGELLQGVEYEFFGKHARHAKYGDQFHFDYFVRKEPHSRGGVITYLEKFAPGVGPSIAGALFDHYGHEAVRVLRTEPQRAAEEIRGLSITKAQRAAEALKLLAELEDTRIELSNLLAGRHFPGSLLQAVIDKWHILAPQRIKRDPFTLLVHGFAGCGFMRCDRLYSDLGHNPARLKRQMICLWHFLRDDNSGHTWLPMALAAEHLRRLIAGAKARPKKAITLGVRSGWLATHKDEDGKWWLAEAEKARSEKRLAEYVRRMVA